jgi:hypothetical protein
MNTKKAVGKNYDLWRWGERQIFKKIHNYDELYLFRHLV